MSTKATKVCDGCGAESPCAILAHSQAAAMPKGWGTVELIAGVKFRIELCEACVLKTRKAACGLVQDFVNLLHDCRGKRSIDWDGVEAAVNRAKDLGFTSEKVDDISKDISKHVGAVGGAAPEIRGSCSREVDDVVQKLLNALTDHVGQDQRNGLIVSERSIAAMDAAIRLGWAPT